MSSTVQPSATDVPETPAPQSGFEGDVVDDSVGGYVRGYVNRVRGGDLGALPAVAGIVVLAILFTVAAAGHVPDAAEHHQPARPGRTDHPAGDGPGLRPPAGRDRPVRRRRERRLRGRDGRADGAPRRGLVLGRPRGHRRRHADRPVHRRPGQRRADPVVRRDPGAVPRLAGRHPPDHRSGRHRAGPRPGHRRFHQLQHVRAVGLDPRGRGDRAVRGAAAEPLAGAAVTEPGAVSRSSSSWRGSWSSRVVDARRHGGAQRQPGAEPQHPAGRGSLRHPDRRRAPADPHLRAHADPRSAGTSTRSAATRRPRVAPASTSSGSASWCSHCRRRWRDQRHRGGVPAGSVDAGRRRRQHPALRRRGRGHRRDQPLRRARPGPGRRPRWSGHRDHRQRSGAARRRGVPELHHHRCRAAAGGERRRAGPPPGGGDRATEAPRPRGALYGAPPLRRG